MSTEADKVKNKSGYSLSDQRLNEIYTSQASFNKLMDGALSAWQTYLAAATSGKSQISSKTGAIFAIPKLTAVQLTVLKEAVATLELMQCSPYFRKNPFETVSDANPIPLARQQVFNELMNAATQGEGRSPFVSISVAPMAPFTRYYTRWVEVLRSIDHFERFSVSECGLDSSAKDQINSICILPVQRGPRFKMLFDDVLKDNVNDISKTLLSYSALKSLRQDTIKFTELKNIIHSETYNDELKKLLLAVLDSHADEKKHNSNVAELVKKLCDPAVSEFPKPFFICLDDGKKLQEEIMRFPMLKKLRDDVHHRLNDVNSNMTTQENNIKQLKEAVTSMLMTWKSNHYFSRHTAVNEVIKEINAINPSIYLPDQINTVHTISNLIESLRAKRVIDEATYAKLRHEINTSQVAQTIQAEMNRHPSRNEIPIIPLARSVDESASLASSRSTDSASKDPANSSSRSERTDSLSASDPKQENSASSKSASSLHSSTAELNRSMNSAGAGSKKKQNAKGMRLHYTHIIDMCHGLQDVMKTNNTPISDKNTAEKLTELKSALQDILHTTNISKKGDNHIAAVEARWSKIKALIMGVDDSIKSSNPTAKNQMIDSFVKIISERKLNTRMNMLDTLLLNNDRQETQTKPSANEISSPTKSPGSRR